MRTRAGYLTLLFVIFSNNNLVEAVPPGACEETYEYCHAECTREHPKSVHNRDKCYNHCERRLRVCLETPPEPMVVPEPYYPPVVVEPYVGPWWGWGGGWHHHHHHR